MKVSASAVEAVLLALVAWVTTPAAAALPFYLSGFFEGPDALFEAYSAMTTTGAILVPPEDLPRTLLLWRAILTWLGGYATLILAAAVFAAMDKGLPAIRRSALLTIRPDNVFSHLPLAAGRIALLYGLLTASLVVGLMLTGLGVFDSLVFAAGAISTGGYAPVSGGVSDSLGPIGMFLLAMGCLAGALNISIFWDALRDRTALLDPDLAGLATLIGGVGLLFYLSEPEPILRHLADALFDVTTAGYSVETGVSAAPLAALFAALIGGAAASTTGGIKVSRILLLWKRMGAELSILADPSSIVPVEFRGRQTPDRRLIAVWAYVLAFLTVLGFGTAILSALGTPFVSAFTGVASMLANAGPLYETAVEGQAWSSMEPIARTALIPVMILGRLEVIAALTAIWALFFRR
ncbi:MAG: TrkH family potassium uptake protein [Alphaproteobacteria bacterium]|nr:TrkH family potassium uptake protein [Alphaproteobacteria bacterium]